MLPGPFSEWIALLQFSGAQFIWLYVNFQSLEEGREKLEDYKSKKRIVSFIRMSHHWCIQSCKPELERTLESPKSNCLTWSGKLSPREVKCADWHAQLASSRLIPTVLFSGFWIQLLLSLYLIVFKIFMVKGRGWPMKEGRQEEGEKRDEGEREEGVEGFWSLSP